MDPYILHLYPAPGGRLDLIAGLKAWIAAKGRIEYPAAYRLDQWDPADSVDAPFATVGDRLEFNSADPDSLAGFIDGKCVEVCLDAPFYTPSIEVYYYPYAPIDPLIQWVYHYPHRWGLGEGGLTAAYRAFFAFAHAAGAAYVLTSHAYGYDRMSQQFVQDQGQFCFALDAMRAERGHSMLALDINIALGAKLPRDTPTLCRESMPSGYTRHWLKGHSPPGLSDDWPRLKRPGPRPL
ncbi:hypothetical protein [Tuwongella immobilis]|uniref:Uncharacterized protein n=1 Tax=Tuwongella immobilis TaxID=692036 RepID=A0A6C2YJS6_9BACT|nr:hypothetical protein [Tuwongella immobilis]VIP01830.1 unnamed protein product [Tuwongella immobilis]VTR99578.1 unnamed protein product [Tuwongella immobilis]